jgi:hypothetical protein
MKMLISTVESARRVSHDKSSPCESPQKKVRISSALHSQIYSVAAFFDLSERWKLSRTCQAWRRILGNSLFYQRALKASGLPLIKQESYASTLWKFREVGHPEGCLGIAEVLYETDDSARVCGMIQHLMTQALNFKRKREYERSFINCELLQSRVSIYDASMDRTSFDVFHVLNGVRQNMYGSSEQKMQAFTIQAFLRARHLIQEEHMAVQPVLNRFDELIDDRQTSDYIRGMAQYGKAMFQCYSSPRAPTKDIFSLFKAVRENSLLPKDMRANAYYCMAKLRVTDHVKKAQMSDEEAYAAMVATEKVASGALLTYKKHASYWWAMMVTDGRAGANAMSHVQAFDAFKQFVERPDVKQHYVPFARLEMAKMRVTNLVGDDRMADLEAAGIFREFYDNPPQHSELSAGSAIVGLGMLFIEDRVPLYHSDHREIVIHDRLYRKIHDIFINPRMHESVRIQALLVMAILRCQGHITDDQLTCEQAYADLETVVKMNAKFGNVCGLWRARMQVKKQIGPEILSDDEAKKLLHNYITDRHPMNLWVPMAKELLTSFDMNVD